MAKKRKSRAKKQVGHQGGTCRTLKYYYQHKSLVPPRLSNPDVPESYIGVQDPALKRLRALAMIKDRLTMTPGAMAVKYNVDPKTIERTLSWAKRANLLVEAEDQVLQSMVPKATKVLEAAMNQTLEPGEDGPIVTNGPSAQAVKVALEVYKGTGILRKPGTKSPANPVGDDTNDLAKHIQALRAKAALNEATTEGELIHAGLAAPVPQLQPGPTRLLAASLPDAGGQPECPPAAHRADVVCADGTAATGAGEAPGLLCDEDRPDGAQRAPEPPGGPAA